MIYLYGIKTLSTQFYMRRKFRLEYKKMRPQRVYSIGNLQKTKFYMGTPKGESTKTAIS